MLPGIFSTHRRDPADGSSQRLQEVPLRSLAQLRLAFRVPPCACLKRELLLLFAGWLCFLPSLLCLSLFPSPLVFRRSHVCLHVIQYLLQRILEIAARDTAAVCRSGGGLEGRLQRVFTLQESQPRRINAVSSSKEITPLPS